MVPEIVSPAPPPAPAPPAELVEPPTPVELDAPPLPPLPPVPLLELDELELLVEEAVLEAPLLVLEDVLVELPQAKSAQLSPAIVKMT